jgi:ADP-ribose pyrophosphatase YjhB (NUDIX family)
MELIREINDSDIGYTCKSEGIAYKLRKASRTIVLDAFGKIALLYVSKNNYHKLPGGGIEADEDIEIALNREVMEEVGVKIHVLGEVGMIIEYRDEFKQLQISYCYYSEVIGEVSKPTFTDQEMSDGFQLKWVPLEEAVNILENDRPNNYMGKFIQSRDLLFLKKAYEILKNS